MFDEVAPTYDKTNDLLSFGQSRLWRGIVAKALTQKAVRACSTWPPAPALRPLHLPAQAFASWPATLARGCLAEGRKRHPEIEFVFADATKLPFKAKEFDATTISFGLRNVVDVEAALSEMFRVTKPGGRIVICEFSKVSNPVLRRSTTSTCARCYRRSRHSPRRPQRPMPTCLSRSMLGQTSAR